MNDTSTPDRVVRELLTRAADDGQRPLHTDLGRLLARARADRRRRRRVRAAGATFLGCAAVAAVAVTPGILSTGQERPGPSGPDEPTSRAEAATVGHREVVRRCLPQLDKYGELPMYARNPAGRPWRVANADLNYRAGDVVSLVDARGGSNPVLCRIPRTGEEERPVPFDAFLASPGDGDAVAALCTEAYYGGDVRFDPRSSTITRRGDSIPDLRDADPVATAGTGPLVVALLTHEGQDYRCLLGPVTWDVGVNEVEPDWPLRGGGILLRTVGTGASAKSVVDDERTYVVGAGRTSRRAARIEVTLPDGSTASAPVRDGVWSFAAQVPGFAGIVPLPAQVLARDGSVLWSGNASG
ncbi:hypothetical protein [Nocardioides sp. GXQ0305]|uniref:hypothetical protein n=1 Tax=Nocardioides sp. GXQ0305 TaxID=3423912 RepID=UPI003D7E3B54